MSERNANRLTNPNRPPIPCNRGLRIGDPVRSNKTTVTDGKMPPAGRTGIYVGRTSRVDHPWTYKIWWEGMNDADYDIHQIGEFDSMLPGRENDEYR